MDKPTIIRSIENENGNESSVIYYYNYDNKDYLVRITYQQNSEKIQSITQLQRFIKNEDLVNDGININNYNIQVIDPL